MKYAIEERAMLTVHTAVVTAFSQNSRVLLCTQTAQAVIVDPGGDPDTLLQLLTRTGATLTAVWLTHSHVDHCGAVAELLERFPKVALLGHRDERALRENVLRICQMYGLPADGMRNCPEPTQYLSGGETIRVGNLEFEVLFTPGHSPGHLCFLHRPSGTLVAGDTLFAGSIGRTDLPGGDHQLLLDSIESKIMTLPDEVRVLSGHGPDTTVGAERRSNPFLRG
ncbi:MAG: MBL fold metallo-hydrolase [Proteobacteria bacterium]|nr:MBL fold metallo-hydrolase [Pseudomonadota bacterium]